MVLPEMTPFAQTALIKWMLGCSSCQAPQMYHPYFTTQIKAFEIATGNHHTNPAVYVDANREITSIVHGLVTNSCTVSKTLREERDQRTMEANRPDRQSEKNAFRAMEVIKAAKEANREPQSAEIKSAVEASTFLHAFRTGQDREETAL